MAYTEKDLEIYLKALDTPPKDTELEDYEEGIDGKFIPIGPLQTKLDEFFKGKWNWKSDISLQGYAVAVSGTISYTHPITGEIMVRGGVGAESYKGNSVKSATPIAEASAFKNAVGKIGKAFGKDLNREHTTEFKGIRFKDNR